MRSLEPICFRSGP